MVYTCSAIIQKPLNEVVQKFSNKENLKHWQPGLVSYENISGHPGEVGTVSKFTFLLGKRKMELLETILVNQLPDEFSVEYDAKGMKNIVKSYFKATEDGNTSYESFNEFQMKGFMKVFAWVMPGAFKKQSMKYIQNFKAFVEEGTSVSS